MRARAAIICSLAGVSCTAPAVADDLGPLSAADTTCREVIQDSARASHGVVRLLMLGTPSPSQRNVAVGVDSLNRPRMLVAMMAPQTGVTIKTRVSGSSFDSAGRLPLAARQVGGTFKMQIVSVSYDTSGQMSLPIRTFTTRDAKSGTGDSKSVALSESDTARARNLTREAMRRCVH